jgi:hypothetical protein
MIKNLERFSGKSKSGCLLQFQIPVDEISEIIWLDNINLPQHLLIKTVKGFDWIVYINDLVKPIGWISVLETSDEFFQTIGEFLKTDQIWDELKTELALGKSNPLLSKMDRGLAYKIALERSFDWYLIEIQK